MLNVKKCMCWCLSVIDEIISEIVRSYSLYLWKSWKEIAHHFL